MLCPLPVRTCCIRHKLSNTGNRRPPSATVDHCYAPVRVAAGRSGFHRPIPCIYTTTSTSSAHSLPRDLASERIRHRRQRPTRPGRPGEDGKQARRKDIVRRTVRPGILPRCLVGASCTRALHSNPPTPPTIHNHRVGPRVHSRLQSESVDQVLQLHRHSQRIDIDIHQPSCIRTTACIEHPSLVVHPSCDSVSSVNTPRPCHTSPVLVDSASEHRTPTWLGRPVDRRRRSLQVSHRGITLHLYHPSKPKIISYARTLPILPRIPPLPRT